MFTILGKGIFVRLVSFPAKSIRTISFTLERFCFVAPYKAATLVTTTFSTLSPGLSRRQKEFRKITTSTNIVVLDHPTTYTNPADVNAIAHRVTVLQAAATPVVWAVSDIARAVQAVAVKVPTFWPTRPEVWFSLLESLFATKNITADDTKYHHAVQGLDKTTAEDISAFLLNPPAIGKFDALKTLLISTFGLTQADKDASLLAISGLGDRKPSGLLRYMNSLTTTDDQKSMVYRTLFLRQLPESVRVVLARDPPTSITDLAEAADDILAAQTPASDIAAVSAGEMGRRAHPSSGKTGTRCFYHAMVTPLLRQLVTWPTSPSLGNASASR